MAGYSQTIIVGNVGRDVAFRFTPAGVPVADFSVAVNRRTGKDADGQPQEKVTWYRVTCWRNLAEIANEYVRKGTQIMVVGVVEANAYTNKNGQPAASLDLTADTFQLLGSPKQYHDEQSTDDTSRTYGGAYPPAGIGDIPF